MEKNYFNSRSVVVDRSFKKTLESHYDNHLRKLDEIKNRKSDFCQHEASYGEIIKKKLEYKNNTQKVKEDFDPKNNQVRSLVKHIAGIVHRKSGSIHSKGENKRAPSITDYRRHFSKEADYEKIEIQRQNMILLQRINDQKNHKMTKKDLKRQIKIYQSQRNLLRRVHYQVEKPKKQKQKSLQSCDKQHQDS